MTQPRRSLFPAKPAAAPRLPATPVAPIVNQDEATMMRRSVRETFKAEKETKALVHTTVRLLPDDYQVLLQMSELYTRDLSFFVRVAVHMLADAQRRNPGALSS